MSLSSAIAGNAAGADAVIAAAAHHAAMAAQMFGVPADVAVTPAAFRFYHTPVADASTGPLLNAKVRVMNRRRECRTAFRSPECVSVTIDAEPTSASFGDTSFDADLAVKMLSGIIPSFPKSGRQKLFASALSDVVRIAGCGDFSEYREHEYGSRPERAKGDVPKVLRAGLTRAGFESLGGNADDEKLLALRRWISPRPNRLSRDVPGPSVLTYAAAAGTLAAGCATERRAGERILKELSTASRRCGVVITFEESYA